MSNEFDLDEYISEQAKLLSEQAPDPEMFIRTFDNIRHKTNIAALIPGAGSAVMMGGGPDGFFSHDGTVIPKGHALSVVINTNEETDGFYTWASISTSMCPITEEFKERMGEQCQDRVKAAGVTKEFSPIDAVVSVHEACARALLKHASGDLEFSREEESTMSDRLLDTAVYRMSDDDFFCKIWDEAATGEMTLAMLTILLGKRMITSMIPLGKSMPIALAEEVYGDAA